MQFENSVHNIKVKLAIFATYLYAHPDLGTVREYERNTKTHFTYVLLDHGKLKDLKFKKMNEFRKFIDSVIYIGMGKGQRALDHLRDAKMFKDGHDHKVQCGICLYYTFFTSCCYFILLFFQFSNKPKLRKINEIWGNGDGVVVVQICTYSTSGEAETREACMIKAIGMSFIISVVSEALHHPVR